MPQSYKCFKNYHHGYVGANKITAYKYSQITLYTKYFKKLNQRLMEHGFCNCFSLLNTVTFS